MPGAIATCSAPTSTRTGHSRSANCAAAMSVPSDVAGAAFLAASATAKWPRNTLAPPEGAVPDVAPELHAVEADAIDDPVRALRGDLHLVAQRGHAQHAAAVRHHRPGLLRRAGVENVE